VKQLERIQIHTSQSHFGLEALQEAFFRVSQPLVLVKHGTECGVVDAGQLLPDAGADSAETVPIGFVPAIPLENLGSADFCRDYGMRFPLIGGSMAHGIASAELAEVLGNNGMLGFFGAAGLTPDKVEAGILRLKSSLARKPFGVNLIHSPSETGLEDAIVDLFLKHEIRLVEASAFLAITLPLVRYRVHGIHRNADGRIVTPNRVIGKISRVEVAAKFFAPPPENMLKELVNRGVLTPEQAKLAAQIPVAQDLTAEADSGGHTDHRPAVTLFPTIIALRDRLQAQYDYPFPLRVGAAGGISTPISAAAAFAMGAAYIMTGSVNQACTESGLSASGKDMLAQAGQADVARAPAGDMFEMGVTVQVLKRGTMFPMRAGKLYELYKAYKSIEEIPAADRQSLEKGVFQASLDDIWAQTREFFTLRDPHQVEVADRDPHHKMALIFRWYLGKSPRWAVTGDPSRKVDFQIWCGPAMGAFNEWAKGSFLEAPANRQMVPVAMNLLFGAAVYQRLNAARFQGAALPRELFNLRPMQLEAIRNYL
jgi:PfaD family protein